ncbi:hypothetical protein [Streptomyces sp. NBC_00893]|uniref:hypothetical protein n=1 Tax=Streptomyces sp. NBC_00893 TaxID=2975862 RepID=UPI00225B90CD|nr:hypothetical protein [Streptomyces sp. NBC_00893]MCX4851301.1 hypothetical protein [Streptomyces sp. NBC_00893]
MITLHRLLAEPFDAREQPDSIAKIFRDYRSWLTTRPWFQFETASSDQIGQDSTQHPDHSGAHHLSFSAAWRLN